MDPFETDPHIYLSTACLHGQHLYCQNKVGADGQKKPAECKWCTARCICECHRLKTGLV